MDLSIDQRVEVGCERCGRRIGRYDVMDDPGEFSVHEVEREPLRRQYVRPTGRHRLRFVDDRNLDPKYFGSAAYSFECGCGHQRTIGRAALKEKLVRASAPRISL